MELTVYNIKGEDTGKKVELDSAIFGIEPNDHAIYLDVKQYLANQRHGTHKSKQRAEIAGSTRKIKRQKGTGTARAGSIKSPLFKGGGRVFGPEPRDYSFKLNKKVKRLARKSALAHKFNSNSIKVLEDFTFDTPKTKEFVAVTKSLEITDQKSLIVVAELDKKLVLSSRNVKKTQIITAADLNTYSILNSDTVLMTEGSVKVISDLFKA